MTICFIFNIFLTSWSVFSSKTIQVYDIPGVESNMRQRRGTTIRICLLAQPLCPEGRDGTCCILVRDGGGCL